MSEKLKVLILEDAEPCVALIEYLVDTLGLEAMAAGTIGEARNLLAKRSPEIAILDVELPDGLGTDLLAEIRDCNLPIAVAMLTATKNKTNIYKCYAHRPDAIFIKPLDPYEVGEWIEQQVARRKTTAA